MEAAPNLAEATTNAVDGVDSDQTGAWFWDFGDSAIQIRLEYHIETEALDRWKEGKNTVNRNIQNAFEDAGLEMALPTRTLRYEGSESTRTGSGRPRRGDVRIASSVAATRTAPSRNVAVGEQFTIG